MHEPSSERLPLATVAVIVIVTVTIKEIVIIKKLQLKKL